MSFLRHVLLIVAVGFLGGCASQEKCGDTTRGQAGCKAQADRFPSAPYW